MCNIYDTVGTRSLVSPSLAEQIITYHLSYYILYMAA